MTTQEILIIGFDLAIGIAAFFIAVWVKSLERSIQSLHDQDERLTEKVEAIRILVAGEYVKRSELGDVFDRFEKVLTRIEAKLDNKMDKQECQSQMKHVVKQ